MTERHEICPVDDLNPGERKIVEIDGLSIGVFNVDGEFYALNNVCPHQLAPLCEGDVTGKVTSSGVGEYDWERDGEIVRCPWHHWEFDITTGESVFNPHAVRTRTFDVEVESSEISEAGASEIAEAEASEGSDADASEVAEADDEQVETYGTALRGDEPPVDTFPVEVEKDIVVLYV